jgi:pyruvate formate lyase activating enzyme
MVADHAIKALIFDIRRFSVHDGPGIRTTVFFKGCPLRCIWCQNPESMERRSEIIFFEHKCINCGRCIDACPIIRDEIKISKEACLRCGLCADACMSGARIKAGDLRSSLDLFDEIRKDIAFYKNSGGGITLSGGEPMMQADFIREFADLCKNENMNIAIDTCGYAAWESFEKILPFTDLFLYDLKIMDSQLHKQYTGADNELILNNLIRLAESNKDIIIRVPLIPFYTDNMNNIENIALFLYNHLRNKILRVDLLQYNVLAESKYGRRSIYTDRDVGKYMLEGVQSQNSNYLDDIKEIFTRFGMCVSINRI